jgi:HD-GYP domain-containing protein (c-di-GMP phosphodiesterase class II)
LSKEIPVWAPEVATSLLQSLLKKDPFTFFHCCRVGRAARKLGEAMGLREYELAVLEFSGLFHDIGKMGIPDGVLLKPDRLNEHEFAVMKDHAEMSVQIVRPLTKHEFFRHVVPGVRYHHERFDGKGYPIGVKGEQIPLFARIVMVVDAVDAMLNTRPYRQGLSWDYVKKELVDYQGTQFDPNIAQAFLASANQVVDEDSAAKDEIAVLQILKAA